MDGKAAGWLLWPRALVVGLLATGLGALGHVAAGGALPGPTAMTFLTLASVAVAAPMLLQQASPLRLVLMLVAGQTAVHLGLTLAADAGPGHGAAHHTTGATGARDAGLADLFASHLLGHAPMMLAHLAAAVAVGLWLGHGERVLWTLVRLCRHRLGVLIVLVVAPIARPGQSMRAAAHHYPSIRVALRQSRPSARRGPPLVA